MIARIQAPCATCPQRGCGAYHDKCQKYQEYKDQVEIARAAEQSRIQKRPFNPYLDKRLNDLKRRGKKW